MVSELDGQDEYRELAAFASTARAIAAAQQMVDALLTKQYQARIKPEELYRRYVETGTDIEVDARVGQPIFLGWEYARKRCRQICR